MLYEDIDIDVPGGSFHVVLPSYRGGEGNPLEGDRWCWWFVVHYLADPFHAAFADRKTALEKSVSLGFRISVL